uniref:Wnt inhibitory factor 1 n=1 Tax=Hirondellea gigas TaxID=1518452 RepID=A0A2P2I3S5_9CRUS
MLTSKINLFLFLLCYSSSEQSDSSAAAALGHRNRHQQLQQQPLENSNKSNSNLNREAPALTATEQTGETGSEGTKPKRSQRSWSYRRREDLQLWIDRQQVQVLSGYPMEIYVIREGLVLPYILDPNFDSRLPVIPAEVSGFNFTWQGGRRKRYRYQLDNLISDDTAIMNHPTVNIPTKGRLPRKPKGFRIDLPCLRNASGIAGFSVRLKLKTRNNKRISGTPINVRLRKQCAPIEVLERSKRCPPGYLGANCTESLCYPHCLHGGVCTAPGRCTCPPGYHGRYCQGGICTEKCQHGGKCVQKDRCSCTRGFYGDTCQYSKCAVPCVNGGRCRGANKCRCPTGFGGQHCEVVKYRGASVAVRAQRCKQRCKHGSCDDVTAHCRCDHPYTGRWCRRKSRDRRGRIWL